MKKCNKCCILKSLNEFTKKQNGKNGLKSKCRDCSNEYSKLYRKNNVNKIKEYSKEWRKLNKVRKNDYEKDWAKINKEKVINSRLKCSYNITLEYFNNMLIKQNNSCAICKKHKDNFKKGLYVDQCHLTNKVRGLLCHNCNCGLGYFKDNLILLNKSIEYLKNNT